MIKVPEIGDIVKIICNRHGLDHEIIGRYNDYVENVFGIDFLVIGEDKIYPPSIKEWEILTNPNNEASDEGRSTRN